MRYVLHASRSRRLSLLLLSVAQFLVALDFSVVNVALPSIRASLGFSAAGVGWVVSGYALAFGGFLMVAGQAADLLGRRRLFMTGLAVVAVSSALGGLADTPAAVVAARAAQGLGGAILVPAALALIATLFPAGPERTRALGTLGGVGSTGAAVGVVLGGVLTDALSWRWTFLANVPIALAALALAPVLLPRDRGADRSAPLDLAGALLGTGALLLLLYGFEGTSDDGWLAPRTGGALLAAVALLAIFVVHERRVAAPVLPLALLRSRSIAGANLVAFAVTGTFLPTLVIASTYMQSTLGFSPLAAGFAFLPTTAVAFLCAGWLSSRLIARFGARSVSAGALLAMAGGLLLLTRLGPGGDYARDVLPGLLLVTAGASTMFTVVYSSAIVGAVEASHGAAAAAVSSARQIGAATGAAVLIGTVASSGYGAAFAIATATALAGFAVALRMLPGRERLSPALPADPPPAACAAAQAVK